MNDPKKAAIAKKFDDYLHHLLAGRWDRCSSIVQSLITADTPALLIYEELFRKSLYRVGELWEQNKISVAVEHMATLITEGLMASLLPAIVSLKRRNRLAVVASAAHEEHRVGARMVADVFELNGWDALYLGGSTPITALIDFCRERRPDAIALSLSIYMNLPSLNGELTALRRAGACPILIGGQALRHNGGAIARAHARTHYLENLAALDRYLKHRGAHDS